MHPRHATAALATVVVIVAGACTRDATADVGKCATLHRLASSDVQVMSLDPAKPVARPEVACVGLACLRTEPNVALVVQADGAVWGAWAGEAGRVVSDAAGVSVGDVPKNVSAFVDAVRGRGVRIASPDDEGTSTVAPLPPNHRTCGTTNAGGGLAHHLIKNDGDVWQGLLWARPATNPDVKALPDNAYPLVIGANGTLCAWATQKTPRNWQVHSPSGAVVDAMPNQEHPPAHCVSADVVAIEVGDHPVHLARDGTLTHKEPPAPPVEQGCVAASDPVMPLLGSSSSNHPAGTLRIADTSFERALVATADLAGKPLPPGAQRRRIASAGDGARFVVLTEKIELADCTTRELVHLVDTKAAGPVIITTVRDADVVIAKVSAAAGRFWWVEATPQILDVGNGQRD